MNIILIITISTNYYNINNLKIVIIIQLFKTALYWLNYINLRNAAIAMKAKVL